MPEGADLPRRNTVARKRHGFSGCGLMKDFSPVGIFGLDESFLLVTPPSLGDHPKAANEVVLYEMLTGKQLFAGETVSDTLAQVLTKEPDWEQVPAKVRRLLEACLQKDPKQRLQAIGDWRLLLDVQQIQVAAPSRSRLGWIAATVVLAALAAIAGIGWWRATRPVAHALIRISTELAPVTESAFDYRLDDTIVGTSQPGTFLTISPDGTRPLYRYSTQQIASSSSRAGGWTRAGSRRFPVLRIRHRPSSLRMANGSPFWGPANSGRFQSRAVRRLSFVALRILRPEPGAMMEISSRRSSKWADFRASPPGAERRRP